MVSRKSGPKQKQKGHPKRKVLSLPVSTADGPAENNHLDEPAVPNGNDTVPMEISGTVKTRREDPDVCGLDDETILDVSDLH